MIWKIHGIRLPAAESALRDHAYRFSARVLLVGLKAPLDRLRPDDSILAAIRIFERFDNEASRDTLDCLVSHA